MSDKRGKGAFDGVDKRVAAVIPAYNEAKTIAEVVGRTENFVPYIIVVDDGSTDDTLASLRGLPLQLIVHQKNCGKGESLMSGIQAARDGEYELIVTLDGDLQHSPEYIPRLLEKANLHTIVVGSRRSEAERIPKARYRANQVANFFISWAAGRWIEDTQCGFRVYPAAVFDEVRLRRGRKSGFVFESEILIEACRAGFAIESVSVPAIYGLATLRSSHFKPVRDIAAIVIMVTGKIVTKGMYPAGLIRSCKEHTRRASF